MIKFRNLNKIADLEKEVEKLKVENKQLEQQSNDLAAASLYFDCRCQEKEEELEELEEDVKLYEKELINLHKKHKEVANKLDIQTSYNERLSAENAELKADVDACRKEIAALEKRVLKSADFSEVQDIVLEKEKLGRSWTPPLDTVLDIVSRKTKKEEILKNENDNLKKKIERLDIQLKLKHEELVESEAERVNLRKWNQQAKELNRGLEYDNDVLLKAEKRFESENEYLKEDVQDLKAEIAELKEQLEAFKTDAIDWEEIAKTRGDEINDLQERIAFYEDVEDGNVHEYQTIIAKQKEQIKKLKKGMKK